MRWLREPLLHFLLLGAGLFALDALLRGQRSGLDADEIVVPAGRVENLIALFAKTWQRAPTPAELRGLVQDHVLEEALYREARALGLEQGDTVIRQRLRQKMEFVVDDVAELADPHESDLRAWLAEHPEEYAEPTRTSFRQVFLSRERRGAALQEDARKLLAQLQAGVGDASPEELGDATLLEHAHWELSRDEVARVLGPTFADRLAELPAGGWSGPVESAYGLHLVRVDGRVEERRLSLTEVRAEVERDWRYARRNELRSRYQEELLVRYRVRIEWPEDLAAAGALPAGEPPE